MNITGKKEKGGEIKDIDTWYQYAPPAQKKKHWQDYRSAKELAKAWCRTGKVLCPKEITNLLSQRADTRGFEIEQAVAKMQIKFDQYRGGRRNADLAMWGRSKKKKIAITVEAKADESYGKTIGNVLAVAKKNNKSNLAKRINQLSKGILGSNRYKSVESLRYQLFHALAATAVLAKEKQARLGILVIHEFVSLNIDFDKFVKNSNDLNLFVQAIPRWENKSLKTGKLLTPIRLNGSDYVPKDVWVSIGKIQTHVPLN